MAIFERKRERFASDEADLAAYNDTTAYICIMAIGISLVTILCNIGFILGYLGREDIGLYVALSFPAPIIVAIFIIAVLEFRAKRHQRTES